MEAAQQYQLVYDLASDTVTITGPDGVRTQAPLAVFGAAVEAQLAEARRRAGLN